MKFGLNIDYYLSAHTRELNLLLLRAGWQLWVLNGEGAAVELGFFVRFCCCWVLGVSFGVCVCLGSFRGLGWFGVGFVCLFLLTCYH